MAPSKLAAGCNHTVLLRSDGTAVAFGNNIDGRCDIPVLPEGVTYKQVAAGLYHTVLLRSDGAAVAFGDNDKGECDIPALEEGVFYGNPTLKILQVTQSHYDAKNPNIEVINVSGNSMGVVELEGLGLKDGDTLLTSDFRRQVKQQIMSGVNTFDVVFPDGVSLNESIRS